MQPRPVMSTHISKLPQVSVDDLGVGTFQSVDDVDVAVDLTEDVDDGTRRLGVLRVLLEIFLGVSLEGAMDKVNVVVLPLSEPLHYEWLEPTVMGEFCKIY